MSRLPIDSFVDELEKIGFGSAALAGGLIGGGAASFLPGNKVRNGIIGAAAGGLIGGTVGAAKRVMMDPNHHRSQQLAAQAPPGDPNYVPTWQQGYR
jgi:hypothetical protein